MKSSEKLITLFVIPHAHRLGIYASYLFVIPHAQRVGIYFRRLVASQAIRTLDPDSRFAAAG